MTEKVRHGPPYIFVNPDIRKVLPAAISDLFLKWEPIIEDIKDLECQYHITTENLESLANQFLKQSILINVNRTGSLVALKQAENNLKVHQALNQVRTLTDGLDKFKETVRKSIEPFSDDRHAIIARVTRMAQLSRVSDAPALDWLFGMGD